MAEHQAFTPTHKTLLGITVVLVLVASFWSTQSSSAKIPALSIEPQVTPTAPATGTEAQPEAFSELRPDTRTQRHEVQSGDTLSSIFSAAGAPGSDLNKILEADVEYLALETLQPGTQLRLTFDDQNRFMELALEIDAARTVFFTRTDDDQFEYRRIEADTHWVSEVLRGSIEGSFYVSAVKAGLTAHQIASVSRLLEYRLNFRRDLRAGDQFAVIVSHEMTEDQTTGKSRVEAISLKRGSRTHTAFRFDDGNYYDQDGKSVLPAFRRWPTKTPYRVSSHFNPNRKHPVTKRIAPHNGVDLATPVGTPVFSTGDGIVQRVGNHPFAGKYIDIDHGNAYKTRYLHLHRILVKKGQSIQRGDRIALSGNTGRSTGAHLHFELHVNGRPVNPLKADIPTAADIPGEYAKAFKEDASYKLAVMERAGSRSNLMLAGARVSFE
ncbi:murein DD-endopeptidase [Marinobacter sp. MBR-99]|jgi:murein DD-endopeptidase|uniref:peptidoglycan DD-metalloendopeptidase family protein n=1 Tax=Marinobacter sp. MBR-99 TaxID=3156461 RepID=UPI00339A8CB8